MNDIAWKWIRECVKKGYFHYSSHAKDRMLERCIEDKKILDCILNGKVMELQPQYKDIHVLFQESNSIHPEVYVVMAAANPPVVVTVCRSRDEVWEDCNGILKRRK